jgi:hypothetical protein
MKGKRVWEIGGFVSGAVLIVFGAVVILAFAVFGRYGPRTEALGTAAVKRLVRERDDERKPRVSAGLLPVSSPATGR